MTDELARWIISAPALACGAIAFAKIWFERPTAIPRQPKTQAAGRDGDGDSVMVLRPLAHLSDVRGMHDRGI